jgi:hypothetical protein
MTPALLLAVLLQATPPKETVTIPGTKVSFDLVRLPGDGTLRSFSIGAKEVTWGELTAYASGKEIDAVTRPSAGMLDFYTEMLSVETMASDRPATMMRWHSAAGYCAWLSKKTGRYFRLPTEREWEYAARAGETAVAPKSLEDVAWHEKNSGKRNHVGGEKKPNAFGLYDLLGNVWEYCLEFDAPPEFRPVLRGGSWRTEAAELSFASRRTVPSEWFEEDVIRPRSVWWLAGSRPEQGFRVVCVPGAVEPKERDAAAARIELQVLGSAKVQVKTGAASPEFFLRVKCRVKNGSGKPLDELELRVSYRNPDGTPHLVDLEGTVPGRPTFTPCWPVIGGRLNDGESRDFDVEVPETSDDLKDQFIATVTNLRYAKE